MAKRGPKTSSSSTTSTAKPKKATSKKIEKAGKTSPKQSKPLFTRLGKVDFTPNRLKHHSLMEKAGCKVADMIALRRQLHSWPEGHFNEVKTQQLLMDTLIKMGVDKASIKKSAKTGLVVDIKGTGKASG